MGNVSTFAERNSAIEGFDIPTAGSGAQQINITASSSVSALEAINLAAGFSLTISGASGAVLGGGQTERMPR